MTTAQNSLLAAALMRGTPPSLKLDPDAIPVADDAEAVLVKIIAEETEKRRESQRGRYGTSPRGFVGNIIDYVDTQHWDEYLQDLEVLAVCSERAALPISAVLDFVIDKCLPSNWRALFWMRAWHEQLTREVARDVREVADEMGKRYAAKQAEAASLKAKAAAIARHSKPGGSRDKRASIQKVWSTGKYATRDLCVTEEWESLGFSNWDTARKALRGTPDPNPWPGKKAIKGKAGSSYGRRCQ